MTRASMMVFALLILNVLLGALCLVVARGERRSASLRLWGWGLLIYAIGLLITIPAFLPLDLRKIVGNALIAFAPVPIAEGILRHSGVRLRRGWTAAAVVLSIAPIIANHLGGHPQPLIDFLAPAPIANVLFLLAAYWLVRRPPEHARTPARFLAGVLAFSVLVWTARMAGIWLSLGGTDDREHADTVVALFAIAQIVISVGSTFALLWIEVATMRSELMRLANTDALTGLPNRRATLERCRDAAARARESGSGFGLLVLDIDHFKQVNDRLGHVAGDAALVHVARSLGAGRRGDDFVGRVGGEEFVVLIDGLNREDLLRMADRLCDSVARTRVPIETAPLAVTLSGGLALFPHDGRDWDELFAAADRRLYAAKRSGRNRIVAAA